MKMKLALLAMLGALCLVTGSPASAADEKPVSFYHDVMPLFKKSCTGCHHPGKLKGELDLTTFEALGKGGKSGAAFKTNDAKASLLVEEISGDEPSMPKEGDPLSKTEVALISRWIAEGAIDDTPTGANSYKLSAPPVYQASPVISALAFSPEGKILAVSGYHEVLVRSADGSNLLARFLGESPRIESLAFSPDGTRLGVAGSAPARFGEIQIWDAGTNGLANPTNALVKSIKVSTDSVFGLSWSPTGDRVAVGCADKSVRLFTVATGKETLKFDNHSDWVFGTTFTVDGKRLLSGSRDRAMKLIDASNGQFIDDINKLLEPAICIARHPKEDVVIYGGELGTARIYKISENQGRTAANNDVNLVKALERLPGPVHAVAYSPDGATVAVAGSSDEIRLYNKEGKRTATLKGHQGAIFALAFHPTNGQVAAGGFDGRVRIFDAAKGVLIHDFVPVPLQPNSPQQASAAK